MLFGITYACASMFFIKDIKSFNYFNSIDVHSLGVWLIIMLLSFLLSMHTQIYTLHICVCCNNYCVNV